jgi:TPR repeat protein
MGQVNLGQMYANGQGVPQSDAEAVAWYHKAAEQGQAAGQAYLGYMYQRGKGVPQSDTEAVAWYRKAAEQGHGAGQRSLGWMYAKGRGISQDAVKAYMWESLALLNGEAKAGALLDEIAKQLTQSQISQAQGLAQMCRASNYQTCE